MEQPTDTEDRVWVPLDELETYLQGLSAALMNMVGNIEATLELMKEKVENQKGENNDDN